MSGDTDEWLVCEACEEEVHMDDARHDAGSCQFCPDCWHEVTACLETVQ